MDARSRRPSLAWRGAAHGRLNPVLPRRSIRALAAGLAAACALVLLPAAASASTATVSNKVLYYTAAPGEANNVSVAYPNGTYTVYDPGASVMTAGPGCSMPKIGRAHV